MAEPTEMHQEGPKLQPEVVISVNANVPDLQEDISENRIRDYDLLKKQIDGGLYDGDGPADVAKTCQEEVC